MPNEEAALKLLFLALRQAAKKWAIAIHHWREALNHFTISLAGADAGSGKGVIVRGELLRYLFANIHKSHGMSRKAPAADVFKSVPYDEGAVGDRCLDLRNALREYGESGGGQVQTWRCELPPAVPYSRPDREIEAACISHLSH